MTNINTKHLSRACSLPICGARLDTVHKIPAHAGRRDAWMAVLDDYRDHLGKLLHPCICARHFRPEDYVHAESRKLNRVAVPSLNIKDLSQLDICKQVNCDTDQSDGETDEHKVIQQRMCRVKWKQTSSPIAEETESKRKKQNTPDATHMVDKEQNVYLTIDQMEASLLGQSEAIKVQEYSEEDKDTEHDEIEEEEDAEHDGMEEESYLLSCDETSEYEDNLLGNRIENCDSEEVKKEQTSVQVRDAVDLCSKGDITIQLNSQEIIIQHENSSQTLHFDYLWLRDFCKCTDCYDCSTHARLFDVTALSSELRPYSASLFQDSILIEWNDDHISKYVISELFAQYKPQKACPISENQTLWTAKKIQCAYLEVMTLNELICHNAALKKAFIQLQSIGVLLIKGISTNAQQKPLMLELLLRRLFPHNSQTHSKEERRFNSSNSQSLPHTNCTFLSESCGLQILSLSPACAAETVNFSIVDGLNAVQLLNQSSRQTFELLTRYKIPLIYRNSQNFDYHTEASIIQLRNGEVERIQFAPYQRGNMPQQDMQQFTKAMSRLSSIIKQKQQQWKLCLEKDMLVILDNFRMCWQVEKVESNIVLDCVYMERKDFLSQLHYLQTDNS